MSFSMAVQVGGEKVSSRYLDLAETGLLESYLKNRGHFPNTLSTMFYGNIPLARDQEDGMMMNNYFRPRVLTSQVFGLRFNSLDGSMMGVYQCCYFTGRFIFLR